MLVKVFKFYYVYNISVHSHRVRLWKNIFVVVKKGVISPNTPLQV